MDAKDLSRGNEEEVELEIGEMVYDFGAEGLRFSPVPLLAHLNSLLLLLDITIIIIIVIFLPRHLPSKCH